MVSLRKRLAKAECLCYPPTPSHSPPLSAILSTMKSLSLITPHAIFVIGTPGAGKTQFAEKFSSMFGAPFIEADKLRSAIAYHPNYTPEEQTSVDDLVDLQLKELYKTKQTFVVEASTEAKVDRLDLAKTAKDNGYEPLFIWVQTDPDTSRARATRAGRSNKQKLLILPEARYEQLVKRFTPPTTGENIVVISGRHTYASQAKTVLKRLAAPNRPERTPLQVPKRQMAKNNSIKVL